MNNIFRILPSGIPSASSAWTPADIMANLYSWHDSDHVDLSTGTTVIQLNDQSLNNYDMPCATSGVVPGDVMNLIPNQLNGHPSLEYINASSGGVFGVINPAPVSAPISGLNTAFSICYVGIVPTLAANDYTATHVIAGTDDADSVTMYYVNLAGFPVFYFQVGSSISPLGFCVIVSSDLLYSFDYTNWHKWVVAYNGAGDFNDAANWTLNINGSNVPVSLYTNGGGNSPYSSLGNHGDAPFIAPGQMAHSLFVTKEMDSTEISNWNSYIQSRYGI